MSRPRRSPSQRPAAGRPAEEAASAPRIIGGTLRGRRLAFQPDPRTRPMKDRVRETLFDLVGRAVEGAIALDLFAGTGALGFEALSRGAARAIFVERHFPTVDALRRSARDLGVEDRTEIRAGDVLVWARRLPPLPVSAPWLACVSPPWPLFADRSPELMALVRVLVEAAPAGSVMVVESDESWDPAALPDAAAWEHRGLPPAILHVRRGLVS